MEPWVVSALKLGAIEPRRRLQRCVSDDHAGELARLPQGRGRRTYGSGRSEDAIVTAVCVVRLWKGVLVLQMDIECDSVRATETRVQGHREGQRDRYKYGSISCICSSLAQAAATNLFLVDSGTGAPTPG